MGRALAVVPRQRITARLIQANRKPPCSAFRGASILPGQTVKLDLYFVAHVESAGARLSESGMPAPAYRMRLIGYKTGTDRPEKAFSTRPFRYPFSLPEPFDTAGPLSTS
jgi:hypothetical protein